jgi:predicted O-methyltransferase YrrM
MSDEYRIPGIEGWMGAEELRWLYDKAKSMSSILEIGCWKGRSTHALLTGCPGVVYAVDHFLGSDGEMDNAHLEARSRNIYRQFLENVGHFRNLRVYKMRSLDAVSFFPPRSIDMVFIDGGHYYDEVIFDLRKWGPVCRKLLCGHDALQSGVSQALNDFGRPWKIGIDSIFEININE